MEPTNGLSSLKIALLIDFDNVLLGIDDPGFDVELVVNALRERGTIVMGRCYGDWYRHNRHRRKLMEQGLELVETPAFGPVIKNSADIRIALDGLEIGMTQHHIDTFCLVSGDSDFLPLIKKLQYLGKQVLVICGNRFTSDMLRRNCNEFISYENLLAQSVGATEDATTLDGAFTLLHRAMTALRERGSEIRSSTVKQMMLQLNPTFSERNFGCPQFRGFLDKAVAQGLIKLGGRDRVSGEFSVLLPEEDDDKIPAEQRLEIKNPEVKPLESKFESKVFEAKVEAKIDKPEIKNPEIKNPVAREPRGRRERVKIPDVPVVLPPGTDLFAPATSQEADDHSTSASSLMSRGLRRGKLRFSGKSSKPERIEQSFEEIFSDETEVSAPEIEAAPVEMSSEAPVNESENLAPSEARTDAEGVEIEPGIPASDDVNELANQVAEIAAQISVGTQDAPEIEASPVMEAALEANSFVGAEATDPEVTAVEVAKKPARRRRRGSKAGEGEKAIAQTEPADETIAAQNEADADAMGLSFPGAAFEVTEGAPPEALVEMAAQPEVEVSDAVVATEPTDADAPKKAVRRRRSPRKKADAAAESE